jgi:hypothetical protein
MQQGHVEVGHHPFAVAHAEPAAVFEGAEIGELDVTRLGEGAQGGQIGGLDGQGHPLLGLRHKDLPGGEAGELERGGGGVEVEAATPALAFPAEYLGYPLVHTEDSLRDFLRTAPYQLLIMPADSGKLSLVDQVRSLIGHDFSRGFPGFERITELLHMSAPTLRRRLKREGTMTLVGVPEHPHPSPSIANLIFKRRSIAGSLIGGIAETQEMLDFCAEKGIVAEIEMIAIQQINDAYERMLKSDVKYRFVIDSASLAAA